MLPEDVDLQRNHIQRLSSREGVAAFFVTLGYPVERIPQTADALGITAESLKRQIVHIEQIAVDNEADWLHVYLLEMKSIRVADRQALARAFRNRSGDFLLVITTPAYDSLDFVLMERQTPEQEGTGLALKQDIVRPRVLTVNRQKPSQVAQRVLRRFTYTEPDPFYQVEKLLSAYTVAEWSEPLFNNRALFSDYYLNVRLRDSDAWQEDPTGIYHDLQGLFSNVRGKLKPRDDATTRSLLIEPALQHLGFDWQTPGDDNEAAPDLRLTERDGGGAPLALCLAYPWNRHLDMQDPNDTNRPDDIPGQRVVSVLEGGNAPYVILTNGKLWRLYAAAAHSRATNYYEIDLEETLSSPDRDLAIRYFWLFFRAGAFTPHPVQREGETREMSFLDGVMEGSETYAKELGERLKERIFDDVFPHFARGFIDRIRQMEGRQTAIDQPRLDLIYQATLTFLYRLMFLLYAESRDLLPVKEERGYAEISLQTLKEEIAKKGKSIVDEAPDHLERAYDTVSTALYDRLTTLFEVIDRGDKARNVPRYNGGLFVTEPDPDDDSPEGRTAAFLRRYAIPDRYLAMGLDRLARDIDPKRHDLAMIDFKSLGVRQLGSIYEGLLEFKLRIATEEMAIVKGKRTEEVIPAAEAGKRKVRGTLDAGEVYLENTRQERKATGSYYTPDYIVKYIVEHTVGPVLEEKFAALTGRLRAAEKAYHQHRKNAAAKSQAGGRVELAEKFWNGEAMQRLAYDALDVKVLDPAMGSGHFLVQAVDFITDRMLNFLNGFPDNPVRASLSRTRQAILDAMADQEVSIDPGRLNDVALLKRQVLKRCVYGVDLNPMAVELAKVSLWLDAFTLGAPLSFLDHHLRCGNSLIGTTAREADAELSQMGTAPGQMTFLEGPFRGLLRSAELMRGIGELADATIEQAQESANLFESFEQAALPYKRLLDIYVMRDFGVKRADEFLRLHGVDAMKLAPGEIPPPYDEVIRQRQTMYDQYRFFHWDLEFPEVFLDLDRTDWKADPGFDAVVGNPPYDVLAEKERNEDLAQLMDYVSTTADYAPALGRKLDLFRLFTARAAYLIHRGAYFGFILPMSLLADRQTKPLRRFLVMHHRSVLIDAFPQKDDPRRRVFFDAKLPTCIMIVCNLPAEDHSIEVSVHPGRELEEVSGKFHVTVSDLMLLDKDNLPIPLLQSDLSLSILRKLVPSATMQTMDDICPTYQGEINETSMSEFVSTDPQTGPQMLRGGNVQRYEFEPEARQGVTKYINVDHYQTTVGGERIEHTQQQRVGYQRNAALDNWKRLIFAPLPVPAYCFDSVSYYLLGEPRQGYAILALMNSALLEWRFSLTSSNNHVNATEIAQLPVPVFALDGSPTEREASTDKLRQFYESGTFEDLLVTVSELVTVGNNGVAGDLLAFLAQQMIALNEQKQAEVKRFLGWVEAQIGAQIDDLSGKTILAGYLGDYQKGEDHLPFAAFIDRLHRNKARLGRPLDAAIEHRLAEEYAASLEVLLPIKQQLAETDGLIDQIVYRLYGLTDEEIAIVEGRE